MDVKDLAIGDYIMLTENRKVDIVTGISNCGFVDLASTCDIDIEDISPIELTNKILRQNGFYLDEIAGDWQKGTLLISGHEVPYFVSGIEISYVHELQNVARLLNCDLEELELDSFYSLFKKDDIVLARDSEDQIWIPYKFYDIFNNDYRVKDLNKVIMSFKTFKYCIPYNEKTFKLVGTKDSFKK